MKPRYKNNAPTIQQLRNAGYQVFVAHEKREGYILKGGVPTPDGKRAYTTVSFRDPDGSGATSMAVCHPDDNWDRKKGVAIALGRAWKAYKLSHRKGWIDTDSGTGKVSSSRKRISPGTSAVLRG